MNIESISNKHVVEWAKLKTKKYRDLLGLFIVEGEHLIKEALKSNCIKEIISIDKSLDANFYVTKEIMKKLTSQVTISNRIAICYKLKETKISNKILILDGIQDPGNLGTIIRSAYAFGFKDIILSNNSVDLYNEKVIRASEGIIFLENIIRKDLDEFLKSIKNEYQILVTNVRNGKNIRNINLKEKLALIIGNEGNGVKSSLENIADELIKIPIDKNVESLNAGVAASILMYEVGNNI